MTNVNYQNLYEKLEDNNLPELKTVLKSRESIFEFLKFQSIEDNSNTPLHVAFAAVNIDLIKFLIKDLSSSELQEIINIQNKGGINPAGKILDIEEGSAESLEKIVGAFASEEMKKNVLISYGVYNETILHQLVKYYDSELFTKLLEIAKSNKLLSDILYAQDEVNDNPLHAAIINNTPDNNTQEFITKILTIAKENGIIFDILKSQGENDNTVIHLGFANEDAVISSLVVDSLTKLKNEEIAEIIEIQNKGGIKVINNLFESDKLEIIFQNIADKTILLNSIVSNVLNDEELGYVEDDNKSTVKAKITAIYNLIKDQAELKQKLVNIINLEATEYNVTDFFNNEIIEEKINEIIKAQKEAIANAKSEDDVATAYAAAEDKLAKLKDVFAKLDAKVKTEAENSLKTTVTEKIAAFVDSACKKEEDELVEAQNCLDIISNVQKTDIFKNVIEGNLKEIIDTNKISAQEQLEKTNISLDDIKKGLSNTFYYAKDLIVNKDIARYESASDSDKKSWASETRKIMTKLKSGIEGKIPGIDKIDGYNKIYVQDALGRSKDTKTFIKNIVEKDYKGKVESNTEVSKKAACDKFNLNESECTDPKIMESIKTNVCNNNLYIEKDTNAYKLFCDANTSDIDGLSFDDNLVTELDYA